MKKFLSSTIFVLLAATAFAQSINDGLKLMDSDELQKARDVFTAYTKASPADADGFFHLGNVNALLKDAAAAKTNYAAAIAANPKAALSQIAAGRNALAANDTKTAEGAFDKALRAGKKSTDTYRLIAESYVAMKNWAKADEWYNEATEKDGKNSRLYMSIGDRYLAQNNGGDAVTNYERANFYDKTNAVAFLKVAKIQDRARLQKDRLIALEKARTANDKIPSIYRELSDYYYDSREYAKSKENYKKYMDMVGATVDMQIHYLNLCFYCKEYKDVLTSGDAILKANPGKNDVYRALGYAYLALGDSIKSVAAMEKFINSAKKEDLKAADYEFYGNGLMKLKKDSLALLAFDKGLALDTTSYATAEIAIKACTAVNKFAQAAKYATIVVARKANSGMQDIFNVGYYYYVGNDFANAEAAFKKVITKAPTSITGYQWAADAATRLDAAAENPAAKVAAKGYYEKVVEIATKDAAATAKNAEVLKTAYGYLAVVACKAKDVAKATEYANKILATTPEDENAKAILGGGCN
ncbi:MAG: hypothetical protein RI894_2121 [Bacteroidota bacterium]|jgi:tetratricopeptide (TPR) repeat protein